jgi:hypothetical protein
MLTGCRTTVAPAALARSPVSSLEPTSTTNTTASGITERN